jgi:ABC-type phosphate transport system substrate-binding protein
MRVLACVLVSALLWLATGPLVQAGELELAVIVHPSRAASLTREVLTHEVLKRVYLKRQRFWDDGHAIVAINQEGATPAREAFTRLVFGDEAARLPAYWNQQYFDGVLPPIILGSEEAVVRYVASRPDAIGYVDARHVDASVATALLLR